MPSYDYVCRDCDRPFTLRLSMAAYSEGVRPVCTECGSANVERSFSRVNVLTGTRGGGSTAAGCGPGAFT
jgi:putative FmdB family regulatory protein